MSAEKIYLKVDFAHNNLAKELGAKFDGEKKKWYYWKNDDPEIDEMHDNKLRFIADWFWPKIITKYIDVIKPEPIRFYTGEEILNFLERKRSDIYFTDGGFCRLCDSNISSEFVFGGKKDPAHPYCLHHISDKYMELNNTEKSILLHYLEITETSPAYLKYKQSHS